MIRRGGESSMGGVCAPCGSPELEDLVQDDVLTWLLICAGLIGSPARVVGWRSCFSPCVPLHVLLGLPYSMVTQVQALAS